MGVPEEVVHPVGIQVPVDQVGKGVLTPDEGGDTGGVEICIGERGCEGGFAEEMVDLVVIMPRKLGEEGLARVRERPVPDIVEEPGRGDQEDVGCIQGEVPCEYCREVHGAEGVLEPGMVRPGINEVRKPELLHVPEALDRWRVKEGEETGLHLHVAVHRVLDELHRVPFKNHQIFIDNSIG